MADMVFVCLYISNNLIGQILILAIVTCETGNCYYNKNGAFACCDEYVFHLQCGLFRACVLNPIVSMIAHQSHPASLGATQERVSFVLMETVAVFHGQFP